MAPGRYGPPLTAARLDPCVALHAPSNEVRELASDPANNSTFGTLDVRRTITNNTGSTITRLRYRVAEIATFPAPSGISDLRPRTSTAVVVTVDRAPCGSGTSNVTVAGTTLEQPPSQPNGGGFNSTFSIPVGAGLAPGESIDVRFLFGIQQTGLYKMLLVPEALPSAGGLFDTIRVAGCTSAPSCPDLIFRDSFDD